MRGPNVDCASEHGDGLGAGRARQVVPRLKRPCALFLCVCSMHLLCTLVGLTAEVEAEALVAVQRSCLRRDFSLSCVGTFGVPRQRPSIVSKHNITSFQPGMRWGCCAV